MSLTRRAAMRGCVCTCARASSEAAAQHERVGVVAYLMLHIIISGESDPPGSGRTSRSLIKFQIPNRFKKIGCSALRS